MHGDPLGANIGAGIAAALEHDGVPVRVSHNLEGVYGSARVLDRGDAVRMVVLPVRDAEDVARARQLPGYELAGSAGGVDVFVRRTQ